MLISIIISKPNKVSYDTSKTFRLIILLNTLGKLIEKVIGERFQFQLLSKNIIYSYQLDGLKQQSTTDAGIILTYLIYAYWIKYFSTNTLAFDIIQFFPSLNHQLLLLILDKAGFNSKISQFF